jgi:two-component system LytT family response regulator
MTIRTVIVDDEPLARSVVREFLATHRDIEIVGECANGFEAVKAITEQTPDLVFLDVQMPKLNGFEVLELIDETPAVIFVTAYDTYALRAFEVHAVDYLLKPFSRERMDDALERAKERLKNNAVQSLAPVIAAARAADFPLQRLLVRDGSKVHIIPVDKIDCIRAQDDYVSITSGGKTYLKQDRLADLAANLDPGRFVRIHRSSIVNVEQLARIEIYAKDSRIAILRSGTKLPVSRSGYEKLKGLL